MAKILIVDDEKPIRSAIREILEFEKHDIEECENGVDALKRIREKEYDILLCDVKMPKMSGEELMEKVNEINYPSSFIVMSAHGNIDTAVSFMKKGAFDYLPKPFSMDKLLSTIKNAIERNTIVVEKRRLV